MQERRKTYYKTKPLYTTFTTNTTMATNNQEKRTSIKIKESTRQKLRDRGRKDDTYDDIVNELVYRADHGNIAKQETEESEAITKRMVQGEKMNWSENLVSCVSTYDHNVWLCNEKMYVLTLLAIVGTVMLIAIIYGVWKDKKQKAKADGRVR